MGNTTSGKGKGVDIDQTLGPRQVQVFDFTPGKETKIVPIDEPIGDDFEAFTVDQKVSQAAGQASGFVPGTIPTVFKWEYGGKSVSIAGTFNNWRGRIPMVRSHGDFVVILNLPEGQHQYKFLVDDKWVHDTGQPAVDNEMGTKNNVVTVQSSDFEVFEALAVDSKSKASESSQPIGMNRDPMGSSSSLSSSPPGTYVKNAPQRLSDGYDMPHPPHLPPHLLQVILNKDVPVQYEPSLLPEPNHVMLNHLYALSIKDGVMVLSATHRYRKKYVTTLFYKPIDS